LSKKRACFFGKCQILSWLLQKTRAPARDLPEYLCPAREFPRLYCRPAAWSWQTRKTPRAALPQAGGNWYTASARYARTADGL